MLSKRSRLRTILLISTVFYLIFLIRSSFWVDQTRYFTLIDDAMISMRYGEHLSLGLGLVWNIGELPFEGFTSLGWVLLMALFHMLRLLPNIASLPVLASSVLILLVNTTAMYKITELVDPSTRAAPVIAAGIASFYFPLVFWSLRGMETGLLVLLINLALWQSFDHSGSEMKKALLVALFLCVAVLVRMDALIGAFFIAIYWIQRNRSSGLLITACLIVTCSAVLIFQRQYFGDWLPNTYYLKTLGVSLAERVQLGFLVLNEYASRDFLLPLFVSLIGLFFFPNLRNDKSYLLLGLFAISCLYSIWVGGDYAEPINAAPQVDAANRFILGGVITLVILMGIALERLVMKLGISQFSPRLTAALILAVLMIISGEPWIDWMFHNAPLLDSDISRVKSGLWISQNTKENAMVAAHAVGQIGYYSERKIVDLLGKNDPVIAKGPSVGPFRPGHNKWNYEYSILEMHPDLIADEWGELRAFMAGRSEYQRLDSGMYFRTDSEFLLFP